MRDSGHITNKRTSDMKNIINDSKYSNELNYINESKRADNKKIEFEKRLLELENEKLEQREKIFDLKIEQLKMELSKLAAEKESFKKEKEEFYRNKKNNSEDVNINNHLKNFEINGKMYFLGVKDELSLKKRYRDLLKLFHPDCINGDIDAMQEINREYNELKKKFEEV